MFRKKSSDRDAPSAAAKDATAAGSPKLIPSAPKKKLPSEPGGGIGIGKSTTLPAGFDMKSHRGLFSAGMMEDDDTASPGKTEISYLLPATKRAPSAADAAAAAKQPVVLKVPAPSSGGSGASPIRPRGRSRGRGSDAPPPTSPATSVISVSSAATTALSVSPVKVEEGEVDPDVPVSATPPRAPSAPPMLASPKSQSSLGDDDVADLVAEQIVMRCLSTPMTTEEKIVSEVRTKVHRASDPPAPTSISPPHKPKKTPPSSGKPVILVTSESDKHSSEDLVLSAATSSGKIVQKSASKKPMSRMEMCRMARKIAAAKGTKSDSPEVSATRSAMSAMDSSPEPSKGIPDTSGREPSKSRAEPSKSKFELSKSAFDLSKGSAERSKSASVSEEKSKSGQSAPIVDVGATSLIRPVSKKALAKALSGSTDDVEEDDVVVSHPRMLNRENSDTMSDITAAGGSVAVRKSKMKFFGDRVRTLVDWA